MKFDQLITILREKQIKVSLNDDKLKIAAKEGALTPDIIASLKEHKAALIQQLKQLKEQPENGIPPATEKSFYSATATQRRLYFLWLLDPQSTGYNMTFRLPLEEEFSIGKIQEALQTLVERHESLRTTFHTEGENVVQKINDEVTVKLESYPVGTSSNRFVRSFNLNEDELIRAAVLTEGDAPKELIIDMHHIISDGISGGVLLQELQTLMEGDELPSLTCRYRDYSEWLNSDEQQQRIANQEAYWVKQYPELPLELSFPLDFDRPLKQTYKGASTKFEVSGDVYAQIKQLSRDSDTTLFMSVLSLVSIWIAKLTGSEDVVIGTPVSGRIRKETMSTVGLFINTLAIRTVPSGKKQFKDFLPEIKEKTVEMLNNQEYPFETLIEQLGVSRDASRNPLFDVLYSLQQVPGMAPAVVTGEHAEAQAKVDLTVEASAFDDKLVFNISYATSIYRPESIDRFVTYLQRILEAFANSRIGGISELQVLSEQERQQQIIDFNQSKVDFPTHASIDELFAEWVRNTPNETALVINENSYSYAEVNEEANRLADFLSREQGVSPIRPIAIQLERNEWYVFTMLAALKLGVAYVPLSTSFPKERTNSILNEADCSCCVNDELLLTFMEAKSSMSAVDPEQIATADSTAYIMFTSGSTGKPKGVVVPHRAVVRLVKNPNYVELSAGESVMGLSTFAFDGSTFDLFMPLLNGGRAVVAPKNIFLDMNAFERLIEENEVKALFITTALFNNLVEEEPKALGKVRELLFGGEKTSLKHVERFHALYPGVQLKNVYGPTENTTFSSFYPIDPEKGLRKVPIGKPISNSTCYILDQYGKLMPIGAIGEICVGGVGLAKGYLNNEELTREKFIDHPFISSESVYRTGDTGKFTSEGDIVFIGRVDHQVKIRGHRIEPGEIEQVLLTHSEVEEAIVIVEEDDNEKVMVLFYACKSAFSEDEVKAYLRQSLPEYMVPTYLVQLAEMPLNANGKIDRSALTFDMESVQRDVEKPTNEVEVELLQWCEELLSRKDIGISDNFFELGGHSLKLMKLLSRIEERYEVKLPVAELYRSPDIKHIAGLIKNGKAQTFTSIPKAAEKEFYDLTPSQRRLFLLQKLHPESVAYNIPISFPVASTIGVDVLEKTIKALIERHEILRTSFHVIDDKPVQKIHDEVDFRLEVVEGDSSSIEIRKQCVRPFALETAPLCRGTLVKNPEGNEAVLWLDMHHLVSDGYTHELLTKEFQQLLAGNVLSPVAVQYRDYADWINSSHFQEATKQQESYWLNVFSDGVPVLELPTDFPRPLIAGQRGKSVSIELTKNIFEPFSNWCTENGLTLYMGFISVTSLLLSRLSKSEDILIGSPVAGRGHKDLEQLAGVLINTIVMRNRPEASKTVGQFVHEVKENVLGAFNHQEYPFENLVEKTLTYRDQSRNPLFDVMFVLQNQSSMTVDPESYGVHQDNQQVKVDLAIEVIEEGNTASLGITYSTDLFLPSTIDRFAEYFKTLLELFPNSMESSLRELELLGADEKKLLLEEINATAHSFPEDKTLIDLFTDRVAEMPNDKAIVFKEKSFTFLEADAISNQFGRFLSQTTGVEHGDTVAIKLERSEWLPISMLAILKCGAAYLPIAPGFPESRVRYMEENSGRKVTIDQELLDTFFSEQGKLSNEAFRTELTPEDLAYIIYTSGSTGNPKGCMLNHRGVVNRIDWMWNEFGFKRGENVLQKTTFTFDVSVWEFFLPLCWGNTMVICTSDDIQSPLRLRQLIKEHEINTLHFVPSMFTAFIQDLEQAEGNELESLSRVITSGEALSSTDVNNWYEYASAPIHNLYGPTEASIDVSFYTAQKGDTEIPIGKPIWNTQLYVLGEQQELLPFGVAGEICLGGVGLALGYLNKQELTSEKFIENPHKPGTRIYRTGDIGKWRHDGQLMYLDRLDHQVKIRGYRIELGEIEEALRCFSAINEVAVLVHTNEVGEKSLAAYITGDDTLNIRDLRNGLLKTLPDYMVPASFLRVESLPLTANGKLDRKALVKQSGLEFNSGVMYEAPRNEFERTIAAIWCDVLSREKIGIHERFFELGGDSIKILRLSGVIRKETGYDVPLKELYAHDSIADFAEYIDQNSASLMQSTEETQSRILAVEQSFETLKTNVLSSDKLDNASLIEDVYPMSAIEKGMVFESVADPTAGVYHDQAFYKRSFVNFDFAVFEQALQKVVDKHPILRTAYNLVDFEEEVHLIYKKVELPLAYVDISHVSKDLQQQQIKTYLTDQREDSFDTTKAPLWRMTVYQMDAETVGFAWQFHHAILDGWSNASLITELNNCYLELTQQSDYQLSPLTSGYKDFIVQSVLKRSDEDLQRFWSDELYDYSKPELFTDEAIHEDFLYQLSSDQLTKMEQTADNLGVTVKTFSLAVYLKMLGLLVTDNDLVVGMVTNTRPATEDGAKILGCFLNTIPLRMSVSGHESAGSFVKEVHNKLARLREKEHLEFFDIVKLVGDQTAGQGAPLFDTLFNYVDFHVFDDLDSSGEAKTEEHEESLDWEMTNTFLDFSINKTGGAFRISMTLNRKLKAGLSTERLGQLYLQLLEFMTANSDKQFAHVNLLLDHERHLLEGFNATKRLDDTQVTILDHFNAQVETSSAKIALQENEVQLTYEALNKASNKLANYLVSESEVGSGSFIGIKLPRSVDSVIAMLAVLKTGAAYIPIDVNYPQERINYMIENSQCAVVIDTDLLESASSYHGSEENIDVTIDPNDTAYVIYTSGSTGRPKGVEVSHASLADYAKTVIETFRLTEEDTVLHQASISFDVSIEEIYPALMAGSKLLIANDSINDIEALTNLIEQEEATFVSTTPLVISEFNHYPEKFAKLRVLISGGDELRKVHCDRLVDQLEVYNTYGPTEATVCATYHRVENSDEATLIGSPIPNHQVHILDRDGAVLPPGLLGEICIAGAGVAKGYLNNSTLTEERFVDNPFTEGERMYLTGDLGRWLPDGRIAFAGRVDEQLKIRGYRIEPGEIEAAFLTMGIDTIVAPHVPKDGQKQLVAYLKDVQEDQLASIKEQLRERLPEFMIPSFFIPVEAFKLTPNGKVDKRSLPSPNQVLSTSGNAYIAAEDEIQEMLVEIWSDVLDRDATTISVLDNFFEIGGDSIRILKVLHRLKEKGMEDISVAVLFQYPSIEKLGAHLKDLTNGEEQIEELDFESRETLMDSMQLLLGEDDE